MPHRLDEVRHQLPVAPAMAIRFLLPNSLLARPKIRVREVRHISHNISHAAHHARSAPMVRSEGLHIKCGGYSIFKKHVHRVMIGLVIFHVVHAPAVVAFAQVIHDGIPMHFLVLWKVKVVEPRAVAMVDFNR